MHVAMYNVFQFSACNVYTCSSAENQKSVNTVQQCSSENQKGAISVHIVAALMPFWLWTDVLFLSSATPFLVKRNIKGEVQTICISWP